MGAPLEIKHMFPEALGGSTRRDNLWAACRQCNALKGDRTQTWDPVTDAVAPIFNPRRQVWSEHFSWSDDGAHIVGRTAEGRATILALDLNRSLLVRARQRWVVAGWHLPVASDA